MTITPSQMAQLRSRLEQEQTELNQRLYESDHYGLYSSLKEDTGDLSTIDNHPGDSGTEMFERSKDSALKEQDELHLARIEAALEAMDNGTYGICRVSGEEIPLERLEALPDTLYCVEYAPRQEAKDAYRYQRPVEEEFLHRPFGRSSRDDDEGYNGFDGEDAWQIVEAWGNSDSPGMQDDPGDNYDRLGIEADEHDGYVEALESFVATDITGKQVSVVRNREYENYMRNGEGETLDDL